jgi:hypothetical protein
MAEQKAAEKAKDEAAKEDTTNYGEGDKEIVDARKEASYYCPGCGKTYEDEFAECTGTPESPHQPIQVVPTSELSGDPEKQTAAPSTEQ